MKQLIGLLLLSIGLLGCSSGSDQLTVAEYAEWCGREEQQSARANDSEGTYGELTIAMRTVLDEARSVVPPPELTDYHAKSVEVAEAFTALVSVQPADEKFNPWIVLPLIGLGEEQEEIEDALPEDVRAQLVARGCINEDMEE